MTGSFRDNILRPELQALVAAHRIPGLSYLQEWTKLLQEDTGRDVQPLGLHLAGWEAGQAFWPRGVDVMVMNSVGRPKCHTRAMASW